jgi:hypothetical protein
MADFEGRVENCGICGADGLLPLLWLGVQPLAESMMMDALRYPLALVQCPECSLIQLDYIPPQAAVFQRDHPYMTGNTKAMLDHYAQLGAHVNAMLDDDDMVVDIGANDGTFLSFVRPSVTRLAVEPTNQAQKCLDNGLLATQGFFTSQMAGIIRRDRGPARLVTTMNVLAHVPDPHDFMYGVTRMLAPDGVFITENHDVRSITTGLQIDTIYHEHLRYYSLTSLSRLLSMHGLEVTRVENIPTHGGSFRVYAQRTGTRLSERSMQVVAELRELVRILREHGDSVYGISATTRASTLIQAADLEEMVDVVCEVPGSEKIGRVMPGTLIEVVDEGMLIHDQPEYALLFCWHIADDVIPKLRKAGYRGKFIVPLPEPRVV